MSYLIQSKTRYESKKTGKEKVHIGYFIKVGKRFPFPEFGNKDSAKRFSTKKEAREQLSDIGRSEGNKYKIIEA